MSLMHPDAFELIVVCTERDQLREQVAAQAAVIEKLREALRSLIELEMADTGARDSDELCCEYQDAIRAYNAITTDSTQILEQYVKEKTQAQAAVIERLREALDSFGHNKYCSRGIALAVYKSTVAECTCQIKGALAIPTDSTQILAEVRRAERERVAQMILNGRFLHDESPAAQFAKEVAVAIRAME